MWRACRVDVFVHPGSERRPVPADRVPGNIEIVVPGRIAERVGRVRSAWSSRDVADGPGRQHHRAWPRVEFADDLLDRCDGPGRSEHALFLHPGDSPVLDVAAAVGTLRVDDG